MLQICRDLSFCDLGMLQKQAWTCSTHTVEPCMQNSGEPITEESVAERTNEYTQRYAAAVVQLGQELKLPAVDLWSSMQAQPDWQSSFLCDGLHLTPAGNSFVYDQLQSAINEAYPHLRCVQWPSPSIRGSPPSCDMLTK